MAEYGLFNPEGCFEAGFYTRADADTARDAFFAESPGEYDDWACEVQEICPDHEGEPKDTCPNCFSDDEEQDEDSDDEDEDEEEPAATVEVTEKPTAVRRECCNHCMWYGPINKNNTMRKHNRSSDDPFNGRKQVKELGTCPGSNQPYARFNADPGHQAESREPTCVPVPERTDATERLDQLRADLDRTTAASEEHLERIRALSVLNEAALASSAEALADYQRANQASTVTFSMGSGGRYRSAPINGVVYELEKRRKNPRDGCPDTGWYLYGGPHFGTWCASTIAPAIAEANNEILGRN